MYTVHGVFFSVLLKISLTKSLYVTKFSIISIVTVIKQRTKCVQFVTEYKAIIIFRVLNKNKFIMSVFLGTKMKWTHIKVFFSSCARKGFSLLFLFLCVFLWLFFLSFVWKWQNINFLAGNAHCVTLSLSTNIRAHTHKVLFIKCALSVVAL